MDALSDAFLDLFERRAHGVIATINPDGTPHQTVVWVDHDDDHILVNTARGRRKVKNLERDPRVDLLVVDPDEPERYVEVSGECVTIAEDGADAHDEKLWRRYKGGPKPDDVHADLTRVVLHIEPQDVFERRPPE